MRTKQTKIKDNTGLGYKWQVNNSLQATLDTKLIDSIHIVNSDIQIDGIKCNGQIYYIKTKNGYNSKLISLAALKDKYTNLKSKSAAFMINSNVVNADYDKYMVDENNVVLIAVDNIKSLKENIDLGLINILTQNEENNKKAERIRLSKGWEGPIGMNK